MISTISFFIRTMVLTAIVVLLLQIRWGGGTLEDHAMDFVRSSSVAKPLGETAHGVVVFVRNSWTKITRSINTNFSNALRSENQPGSRQANLVIERSQEYIRTAKEKVREKFIDETVVPGQNEKKVTPAVDRTRASSTEDDEALEE